MRILSKLAESGESREISSRHARYYERILFRNAQLEQSTGEWPCCLASRLNDIRAAMDWAMSSREGTLLGIRLAAYSASLWLGLGLLPECRTRMAQALERLDESDATPQEQILIQMALGAAVMFTVGLGEEFTRTWTRVLSLAEALGDGKRRQSQAGRSSAPAYRHMVSDWQMAALHCIDRSRDPRRHSGNRSSAGVTSLA